MWILGPDVWIVNVVKHQQYFTQPLLFFVQRQRSTTERSDYGFQLQYLCACYCDICFVRVLRMGALFCGWVQWPNETQYDRMGARLFFRSWNSQFRIAILFAWCIYFGAWLLAHYRRKYIRQWIWLPIGSYNHQFQIYSSFRVLRDQSEVDFWTGIMAGILAVRPR